MKPLLLVLFLSFLVGGCVRKKQNPRDPVAGREIIELENGRGYILKAKSHLAPQIEISISKNYFSIAQLSSDGSGVPPITIESKAGTLKTVRSWIEDSNEVLVTDEDGDGLADQRMIVSRNRASNRKIQIEDITHQFSEQKPRKQIRSE